MEILIEVENSNKGRALINFLRQLSFVKVRKTQAIKKEQRNENIFGIWKNRNITKEKIREKAWRL